MAKTWERLARQIDRLEEHKNETLVLRMAYRRR
jgi:hypothetical protein